MPLYGIRQAGSNPDLTKNLSSVGPGIPYTLFDGTETPVDGLKSVAFALGQQGGNGGDKTFMCTGMPSDCVINIEAANHDVDAEYTSVSGDLTPDANGNAPYSDDGQSAFYRANLTTAGTGTMPSVTVQR